MALGGAKATTCAAFLSGTRLGERGKVCACSPWRDEDGDSYMKLMFRASVCGKSIIRF